MVDCRASTARRVGLWVFGETNTSSGGAGGNRTREPVPIAPIPLNGGRAPDCTQSATMVVSTAVELVQPMLENTCLTAAPHSVLLHTLQE